MTEDKTIHIYSPKTGRVTVDIRVGPALITMRGSRITKCTDGYILGYSQMVQWIDTRGFKVFNDL